MDSDALKNQKENRIGICFYKLEKIKNKLFLGIKIQKTMSLGFVLWFYLLMNNNDNCFSKRDDSDTKKNWKTVFMDFVY